MLVLETADQIRKDLAHARSLEHPDMLTDMAKFPPTSEKAFRQRYRADPEFRHHVDEHQ